MSAWFKLLFFFLLSHSQEWNFQSVPWMIPPATAIASEELCSGAIFNDVLFVMGSYYGLQFVDQYDLQHIHRIDLLSSTPTWNVTYTRNLNNYGISYMICYGQNSVQINNKLYIINPFIISNVTLINPMLIFDFTTNKYLNPFSYSHQTLIDNDNPCVVYNDAMLYAIHGWYNRTSTQVYNIKDDHWELLKGNIISRHPAGCTFDGSGKNIFLFGSDPSIERYSVDDNLWYILDNVYWELPDNYIGIGQEYWLRYNCKFLSYDNMIYCISYIMQGKFVAAIFDPNSYSLQTYYRPNDVFITMSLWMNQCLVIISSKAAEHYGNCSFTPQPTAMPSSEPTMEPTPDNNLYIHNKEAESYASAIITSIICVIIALIMCYYIRKYASAFEINNVLVLIIGITEFDDNEKALPGVKDCVENLINLWQNEYGYDVNICNKDTLYCTKNDIINFIDEHVAKLQDTSIDAVIMHILTHGSENDKILTSDMQTLSNSFFEHELMSVAKEANNIPLIKLTFQHTCRGENGSPERATVNINVENNQHCCCMPTRARSNNECKTEEGIGLQETKSRTLLSPSNSTNSRGISSDSDCVTVYGTIKDWTLSDSGDFTKCICDAFSNNVNKCVKKDFNLLLVEIGRDLEKRSNNVEISNINSSLRHDRIKFHPKKHL